MAKFSAIQTTLEWSERKTIILTPHPDDETLGAGGLIRDLCTKKY